MKIALGELSVFHKRPLVKSAMSWANIAITVST